MTTNPRVTTSTSSCSCGSSCQCATASEARLAYALDQFSNLQQDRIAPTKSSFAAQYPEIANKLKTYLPLVQGLADIGTTSEFKQEPVHQILPQLADFQILRQVGQGGMGIVYEAIQSSIHRRVALKVLSNSLVNDPKSLARFTNEVRAVALLDHPNIVNVFGVGTERGSHYYTMRFIEGKTLTEVLRNLECQCASNVFRNPSSLVDLGNSSPHDDLQKYERAASDLRSAICDPASTNSRNRFSTDYFRVVAQLGLHAADALQHAHERGVFHRDIKPSNLMLDHSGHLWVTDFGLAKIESSSTLTIAGDLVGTLRYMSPEQVLALPINIDHRSDIYSLGATLYEMSVLQPLISGVTREEVVNQVLNGAIVPPRKLQKQLPRDRETILLKTVAKDRNDRYASCRDLCDDLRRFLDRRLILARRPSLAMRSLRWSQRNPVLATISIVFTVLTLMITMFSAWRIDASRRDAAFEKTQRKQQEQLSKKATQDVATNEAVSLTIRAAQAWKNRDFRVLRTLMESSRENPENASLERRILRNIADAKPAVLAKHDGEAFCIRLSPDQTYVASGGTDGVRIHRRDNGELVKHLTDHQGGVSGIEWSENGMSLATVGEDGQLLIYRTSDWSQISARRVAGSLVSVGFSAPLGVIVACERNDRGIGENTLHIWDPTDAAIHNRLDGPTDFTEGLSVSFDGSLVAVACRDGLVYVWDLKQQKLLHRLTFNSSISDRTAASSVAFGHQSPILATCARDGSIRVFNGLTGESLPNLESDIDFPEAIAFSPDDSVLGVGFRKGVAQFYELHRPNRWLRTNEFMHQQQLWGVHFSRDRILYAIGVKGLIEYWDYGLPIDRRQIKLSSVEESRALQVTENPPVLASNWQPNRAFERVASFRKCTPTPTSYSHAMAIEPSLDGNRIAINSSNTHRFQIVDSRTYAPISEYTHNAEFTTRQIFSADSESVIMCGHPNVFVSLDSRNLSELKSDILPEEGALHSISYSSDQSRLYLVFGEPLTKRIRTLSTLRIMNSATLERIDPPIAPDFFFNSNLPNFTSEALQYLAERRSEPMADMIHKQIASGQALWIGCSDARDVFVCAFDSGVSHVFLKGNLEYPCEIHVGGSRCSYALSPDGTLLAVCPLERFITHASDTLQLYDTETGRELLSLRYYMNEPWEVRFSRDSRKLMLVGTGITGDDELVIWGDE